MGLLSLLKKIRRGSNEGRLLVLGLDNSGKTTILKFISNEDIASVTPTQGFNVKTINRDGFKLDMWDIGGQRVIRQYWRNYFERTDALIFVIDSFDRKRLEEAATELELLLEDLSGSLTPTEIAESLNLFSLRERAWQIEGCSAAQGVGIEHGINWIVSQLSP